MTPEMYLMQVKNIDYRIAALEEELRIAENEKDEVYCAELCEKIHEDIQKFKKIKFRIRNEIQSLPDNRLSTLLSEFYVMNKRWEDVTSSIGAKSVKNTRERLKSEALKLFAATYPKYFI